VSGVLVLVLSLPLTLLMRSTPEEMGLRPDGDSPKGESAPAGSPSRFVPVEGVDFTVRQALRTWAFWLVALAITMRLAVHSGIFVHLVPLMVWKGTDEKTAALMVGLLAAAAGVGRFFTGWIGDRWSRQRTIAIGMVGGTISLVVLIVSGGAIWQVALFLVLFSSVEAVASLSWALIGEFFGRRAFATLRGVVGLMVSAGSMGVPIVTGLVFDRTGSYFGILVPLAAMYLGIAVLFWVIRRPRGVPAPASQVQAPKAA
jgi:MFS family permease